MPTTDRKVIGIPVEIMPGKPLTSIFHRLSSVLPESQELITVDSCVTAAAALSLMETHSYSQVPIVHNNEIIGLFSYRSFSRGVLKLDRRTDPAQLSVTEFAEEVPFVRLTDEFHKVIAALNDHDAVLVGDQNNLQAIVTAVDILQYLHDVASPYVLAAESELAIRALIDQSVDGDTLAGCAKNSLRSLYDETELPVTVELMTFNDYAQIIGDGRNWQKFENAFGGTRQSTRTKLERLRELRNILYHFKRNLTPQEYDELVTLRHWLLLRVRLQRRGAE